MTNLVEHRTTDGRNSLESEAIYSAKEILIKDYIELKLRKTIVTLCKHVTTSESHIARFNRIEPVITAGCIFSFTRPNLGARLSWQFRNGFERN